MSNHIPRRIGFYSLRKTAHALCKFITQFTPLIIQTFPEATALHAALAAANAACSVLALEIDKVATPGV